MHKSKIMYKIVSIKIKHEICSKILSPFSKLTKAEQLGKWIYLTSVKSWHSFCPPQVTGMCILPLPCLGGHICDKEKMDHPALSPLKKTAKINARYSMVPFLVPQSREHLKIMGISVKAVWANMLPVSRDSRGMPCQPLMGYVVRTASSPESCIPGHGLPILLICVQAAHWLKNSWGSLLWHLLSKRYPLVTLEFFFLSAICQVVVGVAGFCTHKNLIFSPWNLISRTKQFFFFINISPAS